MFSFVFIHQNFYNVLICKKISSPQLTTLRRVGRHVKLYSTQLKASNRKDLFHNIHAKQIISYIHAIGLTNEL